MSVITAPTVFNLNASVANADICGTALAQQNVAATVDNTFNYSASDADALAFLNLFAVSGAGANLTVSFADASNAGANFLKAALDAAVDASSANINQWLGSMTSESVTAHILNTLNVSLVDAYSAAVSIDSAGGAANVVSGMSDAVSTSMYLQLPQATLQNAAYMDGSYNALTSALPLLKGDYLQFVFHTEVSGGVITLHWATQDDAHAQAVGSYNSGAIVVSDAAANAAGTTSASGKYQWSLASSTTLAPAKTIAVKIQMGAGGTAFTGLKA